MPESRFTALVWVVVALGCRDGADVSDVAREPLPSEPVEAVDTDAGQGPGVSLQALVAAGRSRGPGAALPVLDEVDEPLRVDERTVTNRHDPSQQDLVRTYHYEGLSFAVYVVSASGKEILQRVEVTGSRYRAEDGLRVGMTREAAIGIRGQPDRTVGETDIYQLGGEIPAQLRVVYGPEDTVRRLTWIFPVD